MAVFCIGIKCVEEFKMSHGLQCMYEVHGGSHMCSYVAQLKLLAIHHDDEYFFYALSNVEG